MSGWMEFEHGADISHTQRALVEVCRRMYERGFIVAGDGNVSVRVGERAMLVTPSGARKGFMSPDQMVLCDLDGTPRRGERGRASSEIAMHVVAYAQRPDVRAIVHAHPPCAIAHTIAGVELREPLMPEAYCALGRVPTLGYTTPTTLEVPEAVAAPVREHDVLMLARHGSLTLGRSLDEAYDRLEILEHTARISLMARSLAASGSVDALDPGRLLALGVIPGCGPGSGSGR
jgi:L-fuculose-phosphate aldolase